MATLGSFLREKREEANLTVAQISEQTGIQERYITAIENNDLKKLPGDYYVEQFINQYAAIFNLKGDKLMKEYPTQEPVEEVTDVVLESDNGAPSSLMDKPVVDSDGSIENFDDDAQEAVEQSHTRVIIFLTLLSSIIFSSMYFLPTLLNSGANSSQESTTVTLTASQETSTSESESETTSETISSSDDETSETTTTNSNEESTQEVQTTQAPVTVSQADVNVVSNSGGTVIYQLGNSYAGSSLRFTANVTDYTRTSVSIDGQTVYDDTMKPTWSEYVVTTGANARRVVYNIANTSVVSMYLNGQSISIPSGTTQLIFELN